MRWGSVAACFTLGGLLWSFTPGCDALSPPLERLSCEECDLREPDCAELCVGSRPEWPEEVEAPGTAGSSAIPQPSEAVSDFDGDGLSDPEEAKWGLDLSLRDLDEDGCLDLYDAQDRSCSRDDLQWRTSEPCVSEVLATSLSTSRLPAGALLELVLLASKESGMGAAGASGSPGFVSVPVQGADGQLHLAFQRTELPSRLRVHADAGLFQRGSDRVLVESSALGDQVTRSRLGLRRVGEAGVIEILRVSTAAPAVH